MTTHANPSFVYKPSRLAKAGGIILATLPLLFSSQAIADAIGLPEDYLFIQLIADPKTPRTFLSFLKTESSQRNTTIAAVAYGENYGLIRWPGEVDSEGWQLNLAGGVFAQFDFNTPSKNLINADYTIGFPVSYRHGAFSSRFRWYHQSSHLGDEFLLGVHPERINLSYEALEALASYETGMWRFYAGGEYLYHRAPEEIASVVIHTGIEYRDARKVFEVGNVGTARFVAAIDTKSFEQDNWDNAVSLKTGLEFYPVRDVNRVGQHWSLLAEYYNGPSPYGQFLTEKITYWGVGIALSL